MTTLGVSTEAEYPLAAQPAPLAVIIVTYNSGEVLPGLLDSLPLGINGVENVRVIVADNDSRDASPELAAFHFTKPELVRMGRNAGYATAINAAAELAGPESDLLVLNPDIRLMPGCARLLREALGDEGVGVTVPRIMHGDGTLAPSLRREPSILTAWSEALIGGKLARRLGVGEVIADSRLYQRRAAVKWATGAALMISAEARARVGDWDESFFLYSEEVDFMRRVRQSGLRIDFIPSAQATHIGGEAKTNPFLSSMLTANRIRDYGRRHGRFATEFFRLGVALGAALRAPLGRVHRASLRAALTGSLHGSPNA
ncbi:glycosyltransferase family 2 protein [Mesorhizobium sp. RP14(2022)]|uniref:Glycosyltransferase family 2 protein n=1 Tax=Mesorhizobium liriopis TaxID=2953882 RepID=A0ABT1C4R7_9HYPH|nr:glycosyltransferase family 2 protein [Mesorhizobium liriopis]MCO6049126.1 glycosyltransferase family 2 protein [Mesorhizobium liriopis]